MAKEFYTNGVGSSQILNPSDESKIRIYDSKADADLDLANIEENEIIATKAGESEGVVEVVDTVEEDNPNPASSGAVFDYVNNSLEWTFAGRAFTSGATINIPSSSREIKIVISNTGSTITAPELTIPTIAITTSNNDEKLTAWTSVGGTVGTFTVSDNNIAIYISNIASSYVRVWYR